MSQIFLAIVGWPHEGLHALALRLIGRRARRITKTHIDIPDDLSTGQFIFVAGLPALIFWGLAGGAAWWLLQTTVWWQSLAALVFTLVFSLAGIGTLGDLHLIVTRLLDERQIE
jgi:hypothetical protein